MELRRSSRMATITIPPMMQIPVGLDSLWLGLTNECSTIDTTKIGKLAYNMVGNQ